MCIFIDQTKFEFVSSERRTSSSVKFYNTLITQLIKMNTSIEVYQKRTNHRSMPDWHMGLSTLRETARSKRHDAFDLRNMSVQLRNETNIITKWDTYQNNERLRDR